MKHDLQGIPRRKTANAASIQLEIDSIVARLPPEHQAYFEMVQAGADPKASIAMAGVKQPKGFVYGASYPVVMELIDKRDALLNGIPLAQKRALLLDIVEKASDTSTKACSLNAATSAIKLLALLDGDIDSTAGGPQITLNISGLPKMEIMAHKKAPVKGLIIDDDGEGD